MKYIKSISTIIAGAIGVGYLALPYSFFKNGFIPATFIFILAAILILITNLSYADIIIKDKGNRQISGYAKKYLGKGAGLFIMSIIMVSGFGVLLAYSILAGEALQVIFSYFDINLSRVIFSLFFAVVAFFVAKFGAKFIAKMSTLTIGLLMTLMVIIIVTLFLRVPMQNTSVTNLSYSSEFFGVLIFAFFSVSAIPMVDEVIGYNRKKYVISITAALIITFLIYYIFSVAVSFAFQDKLADGVLTVFKNENVISPFLVSSLILVALFSAFILLVNSMNETLVFDYKVNKSVSISSITVITIILVLVEIGNFSTIISMIGNFGLATESLFIFLMWLKLNKNLPLKKKLLVIGAGTIVLATMISRLITF